MVCVGRVWFLWFFVLKVDVGGDMVIGGIFYYGFLVLDYNCDFDCIDVLLVV